jgi:hypothetical protein
MSPAGKNALRWGGGAAALALVVMLALAMARRQPGEDRAAMQRRGEASAPVVSLAGLVGAGLGYLVGRRRGS